VAYCCGTREHGKLSKNSMTGVTQGGWPPNTLRGTNIMSQPKKILILSHIPTRDEMGDVMLANYMACKDACVWKISILGKCKDAICLIKPDILVLPEIRLEFTRDVAQQCKSWGVTVVQKRCEMGVSTETEMDEQLERCLFGNLEYAPYIDMDLVWGQEFANQLIAHGEPEEKIKLIGGLNFDSYFAHDIQVAKGEKKRILFAGGFGYADSSPLYCAPESKPGEKINAVLVGEDRTRRAAFIDMMGKIMDKFPEYEYGIRPHPGECLSAYTKVYSGRLVPVANMVTPVALSWADIVIHPGSTMAFEAHLMNKPTFNYRNTNLDAVVGRIAPLANTPDDMIELLSKVELDKSNANPDTIKDLERYYGVVDGKAHQRAGDLILDLKCGKTAIPNEWPKEELKYPTQGVFTDLLEWTCTSCDGHFHSQRMRNTVKCPYCGIGCVQRSYAISTDENGKEARVLLR
jgi:surface carbohydrate biosynthesis protein